MAARITGGILVLVASALVASGCGAAAATVAPEAATVVPATVPAFISLNTDPTSSQWEAADELTHRFPDRQKAVDSIEQDLKKETGMAYETDVKPALGPEVAVAWLDFANNGENVVVLLQPTDEAAFKQLVAKGNASDRTPGSEVVYQKVGDWQVLSNKQSVLNRFARESAASVEMLADSDSFQSAMGSVPDENLMSAYLEGGKVMEAIREQGGDDVSKTLDDAGTLDWAASSVAASTEGVRFDAVVHGTPGKLLSGNGSGPGFEVSLPDTIPGNALLYFGFHGTKGMFDGVADTPALATDQLRPFVDLLGKVGTLLQGENAIYVRDPPAGSEIPEITLVADPGPGVDGAATLTDILRDDSLGLADALKSTTIAGMPATKIALADEVEIDYANVGTKLIVTDGPGGIEALVNPSSTLAEDKDFTDATDNAGLPDKTQGFLYVNVTGGLALGERLAAVPIPDAIKRNLGPLRSAIEYGVSRPSEIQVTFFLRIK